MKNTLKKTLVTAVSFALISGVSFAGQESATQNTQGGMSWNGEQVEGAQINNSFSSQTVRQVQRSLNNRGFDAGQVDGQFGQQTLGALQAFQKAQGLSPTGDLNQNTFAALGIEGGGSEAQAQEGQQAQDAQQGAQEDQQDQESSDMQWTQEQ